MGSLECSGAHGGGEPQQIPAHPFSHLVTPEADGAGLGQRREPAGPPFRPRGSTTGLK